MARALAALERGALALHAAAGRRRHLRHEDRQGRDPHRLDEAARSEVHNHIRGLSPFPGAWFEIAGDGSAVRVKVLRTTRGEGAGAPGTVLDDRLTIACGEGAVRLLEVQRAGKQAMKAEEFLRGTRTCAPAPSCVETAMPRYKLTIEYDGTPVRRLAAPGQRACRCRAC